MTESYSNGDGRMGLNGLIRYRNESICRESCNADKGGK